MSNSIKDRISALRAKMEENKLDAYVVFGTDPHMSEYLPERWQTRAFISGFTGSYGMVVVGRNKAALWTDSRYFLQAEEQLSGTGIEMMKLRVPDAVGPAAWLKMNLDKGAKVGTDAWCVSVNQFRQMKKDLEEVSIELVESGDLLNDFWPDRPGLPEAPIFEHEIQFAVVDRKAKINAVCDELEKAGANMQIITALDDLAWTLNLRGSDVECNPVFVGYGCVSRDKIVLFTDIRKISKELQGKLEAEGIEIKAYEDVEDFVLHLPGTTKVLVDADRTSQAVRKCIPEQCQIIEGLSVPTRLKAIKTEKEIANIRNAMRKDGVAMLEFLYWLENNVGKEAVNEFQVAEKLNELRSKQQGFKGISFYPIVGYKEHGAIVHLHVTEEIALQIGKDGFLLFDSGGQYSDGTTDITRTVALSELTQRQKSDFTKVLKGMIDLTLAKFPENTRGYHLDILARHALWQQGLNYGHGTGHGVGYFLNVHEGPMSIRQEFNDRVIEAGMVMSNEPGLYREGEYGLRTENVMVCVKDESTEFGNFLRFETLTVCPIDTNAIEKSQLTPVEIDWINHYHRWVYDELSPLVNNELKAYLKGLTKEI